MLSLVTLMLHVPTLLGASPVHVTKDTLEMESLVKVRHQYSFHNVHIYLPIDINECANAANNNNVASDL